MVQSVVHQKYKLGVVSGGKVVFPRAENRSCSGKTVTLLTHDQTAVIVPFNNQLKVYSLETRQCVKTLKYANNEQLTKLFLAQGSAQVSHIALGDVTRQDSAEETKEREVSVFSSCGHVAVLNYKGRLVEEPKILNLGANFQPGETVIKVFQDPEHNELKVLTSLQESSASYTYRLFDYRRSEQALVECQTFQHVLLSAWSANDRYLCVLVRDLNSKRNLHIQPLFSESDNEVQTFPLPSTTSASTTSTNSHFATSMALDNDCSQLAIGFASGVINLINLQDKSSRLLKWHIDSVLSLCFTSDSSYLLSGGWEKVLSFWQLSTNLQQFLPRLSGVVVDCSVINDKFYSLGLQVTDNHTNSDYQLLLLNSTDLNSRVSVSGPLCVYQTPVKDVVFPVSAVSSRSSASSSDMNKSTKKQQRKLLKRKRQDFSSCLEIQPNTKHLYFPHTSAIQAYDFYKNEQVSYQYLASGVNNSMGKVRSELNLKDPIIADVKFTKDGKWMISYEIEYPPDNLLSSNDLSHTLKFWRMSENGQWVLETKVLSPHGVKAPVSSILVAPRSVNNSQGCLTADNNGGIKYWSFDETTNNWRLSKVGIPNNNHFSNSVELAWSFDGSLIFHAFDDKITVLDFNAFKKFHEGSEKAFNELTMDSAVQSIMLVNDSNLIVATQTTLNSVNLLLGQVESSFDMFPYVNGIYKNGHLARMMSCDEKNGRVALVINQQALDKNKLPTLNHTSHVLIFNADLSQRLGNFEHDEYISCIRWNHDTDFIFLDIKNRLGAVSTTTSPEMLDEVDRDAVMDQLSPNQFESELQKLTTSHRSDGRKADEVEDVDEDSVFEFINGERSQKVINMNSFTSMFENIENAQMDTLFDRVLKVIS
ncbi:LANO_0H14554g1_1 [Lachancea nothofagi CBS 11611]|uniref:LANO_0H14554g1_1 n=1 Tax=Lachancea nothofagi CBS 11611 TaxID=1266666 RepID=A0A1G4KMU1_9SACH|nr:LANO_0H14554g1_1 [Lachancea nothofagi CBS 11611]